MKRPHLPLAIILAVLLCSPLASVAEETPDNEAAGFREVVSLHLRRYPAMEMQDLYKLTFQAAMGSEHAVPSREGARQWLDREFATLEPVPAEPATDPLSPDGELIRIHLRAFEERGGNPDKLLDAFVATAQVYEGSTDRLERLWGHLESMAAAGGIDFELDQLEAFLAEMRSLGFPAVRHSNTYRELYQPAYRVVLRELLETRENRITGR